MKYIYMETFRFLYGENLHNNAINKHSFNQCLPLNEEVKDYRNTPNIRHTIAQYLNEPCLVLQLYLPNLLKSGVKSWMKM